MAWDRVGPDKTMGDSRGGPFSPQGFFCGVPYGWPPRHYVLALPGWQLFPL